MAAAGFPHACTQPLFVGNYPTIASPSKASPTTAHSRHAVYRIRTYNSSGFSTYSNEASATTLRPPTAPSLLTATRVSGTQVRLNWRDNGGDETSFRLERSADGITFTSLAAVNAGVTTYTNVGLTAGTRYYYRLRALGPGGFSTYSNVAQIVP